MKASITKISGFPSVVVDGKPYPLTQSATVRTHTSDGIKFDKEYFRGLGEGGIKLYYVTCDTEWCIPETVQYFKEECELLLDAVPDAYIIARIGMHPPVSFTEENPEECVTYSDGSRPGLRLGNETFSKQYPHLYSMASSVWRVRAGKALIETCKKFDELPFSDRIIGYFFAAGGTSEWYYLFELERNGVYGDFSLAFKRDFSEYLREKYGTDENLKKAWRDENASIDNPKIPTPDERYYSKRFDAKYWREDEASVANLTTIWEYGGNIGSFLDIDRCMHVFDFYRAWHLSTAKSQVHYAKIVKELYGGDKLTGAFYGSYGCTDFYDGSTCAGVLSILDSKYMDFLAAPDVYVNRQPGGFTGQREMPDSFALRNTLFIVEEDSRTHLEVPHFQAMFDYYDIEDTYNILKRDFGRNLCENLPSWWYDHHVGGGRYKHEDIYKLFARQTEIAYDAFNIKDRRKGNEIALIYDEESVHCISNQSTKELVEYFRNYEIARVGAGCDHYYHNDMANPDMPDYKLYVFFNTLYLTDEEIAVIHKKLRKNNAVALFVYASGVINPDRYKRFSSENITALTGIKTEFLHEKHHTKFRVLDSECGIFNRLNKRTIYGVNDRPYASNILVMVKDIITFAAPLFYPNDEKAQYIARFLTNGLPAITYKEVDGFRSIFLGGKIVNSDILREIARFAGCHIWCESDDVLYASDNYLCIHASSDGEKTIKLKRACSPYELYEKKFYGEDISTLKLNMYKGQTLTFKLN